MTTYKIASMRVVKPSGKTAENNPERYATVYGEFFTEDGVALSITSKILNFDDVKNADTVIDLTNGILTIPSGERGRKKIDSISQDDILADLEALRAE